MAIAASLVIAACGGGGGSTSGSSSNAETGGRESGGTLNGTYASFPDYMDPAISYTAEGWTAMGEVYIPLLTYKHADGAEGAQLEPGLAKEMPKITNGGKPYT